MKTTKLPKERENTDDQVMIGYSFTSEWLREWCNFSGPITEQSKPKLKLSQITLDTHKNFSNSTLSIRKVMRRKKYGFGTFCADIQPQPKTQRES